MIRGLKLNATPLLVYESVLYRQNQINIALHIA